MNNPPPQKKRANNLVSAQMRENSLLFSKILMNLFSRKLTNLNSDLPYYALQVVLFILNTTLIAPQFYCFIFCLVTYNQSIPDNACSISQTSANVFPKNYYHTTVYSNLTKCFALFPLMPLLPTVVLSLREDSLSEVLIFCLEECDPRSTNG